MRGLAVLLLTALLAVPALADADLERLVADLDGKDTSRRTAAWQQLRNAKDPKAIPLLLGRIDGFQLMGQHYGVMVLESYPPKVMKRTIPKLLEMTSPYLRFCAGFDLYHVGDDRGVPAMVEALQVPDLDFSMRTYMLNRLYDVREERVLAVVRDLIAPGVQPTLLGSVLWALRMNPDAKTIAACRSLFEADDRPDVRFLTAVFLFQAGETGRVDDVVAALRTGKVSSSAFSRMRSLFQVQRISTPPAVLEAIAELVRPETEPYLLRTIIHFLADARYRKVVGGLQKLLGHESTVVAKAAFEALAELGAGFEADALRPLLTGGDPERRLAAADILRRMDDPSGLDTVVEVLRTGATAAVRLEAARVLGGFRQRAAVEPLFDALLDDASTVRATALRSLDLLWRNLFPYRRLDLVAAGYGAYDAEPARRAAVERLRAWWAAHEGGDW